MVDEKLKPITDDEARQWWEWAQGHPAGGIEAFMLRLLDERERLRAALEINLKVRGGYCDCGCSDRARAALDAPQEATR